MAYIAVAGKI